MCLWLQVIKCCAYIYIYSIYKTSCPHKVKIQENKGCENNHVYPNRMQPCLSDLIQNTKVSPSRKQLPKKHLDVWAFQVTAAAAAAAAVLYISWPSFEVTFSSSSSKVRLQLGFITPPSPCPSLSPLHSHWCFAHAAFSLFALLSSASFSQIKSRRSQITFNARRQGCDAQRRADKGRQVGELQASWPTR